MIPSDKTTLINSDPTTKLHTLLPSLHILVFDQSKLETMTSCIIIVVVIGTKIIKHSITSYTIN